MKVASGRLIALTAGVPRNRQNGGVLQKASKNFTVLRVWKIDSKEMLPNYYILRGIAGMCNSIKGGQFAQLYRTFSNAHYSIKLFYPLWYRIPWNLCA